jgi:tRNA1Val (adenine37-N6)-methyltransferase
LEIDPVAVRCCRENLARAGAEARVFQQDLTQKNPDVLGNSFSLVISNPPFTPKGAGRVPPDPARARARHELDLDPPDLWLAAARLLKPRGRFVFCWPAARLVSAFGCLPLAGLMPKRLRLSHGRAGKPASLAMIEAVKGGKEELKVEPPLQVYAEGQEQSEEVKAIYQRLS